MPIPKLQFLVNIWSLISTPCLHDMLLIFFAQFSMHGPRFSIHLRNFQQLTKSFKQTLTNPWDPLNSFLNRGTSLEVYLKVFEGDPFLGFCAWDSSLQVVEFKIQSHYFQFQYQLLAFRSWLNYYWFHPYGVCQFSFVHTH